MVRGHWRRLHNSGRNILFTPRGCRHCIQNSNAENVGIKNKNEKWESALEQWTKGPDFVRLPDTWNVFFLFSSSVAAMRCGTCAHYVDFAFNLFIYYVLCPLLFVSLFVGLRSTTTTKKKKLTIMGNQLSVTIENWLNGLLVRGQRHIKCYANNANNVNCELIWFCCAFALYMSCKSVQLFAQAKHTHSLRVFDNEIENSYCEPPSRSSIDFAPRLGLAAFALNSFIVLIWFFDFHYNLGSGATAWFWYSLSSAGNLLFAIRAKHPTQTRSERK